jgi:hypothetical protein
MAMRVVMRAVALGVMATALLGGCSLFTSSDCVTVGVLGIQVTVVDSRTNQTPSGTVVTVTDGAYQETLTRNGAAFIGAGERPGLYTVTVDAPGYVRWTRENVRVVRSESCGYLQPVVLTAALQPDA